MNTNSANSCVFLFSFDYKGCSSQSFVKEYINRKDGCEDGLNIFRMLDKDESTRKPKGKIHVFHNWDDDILQISSWPNWVNRLGQAGMGTYDKWFGGWGEDKNLVHLEIRNYYENIDAGNSKKQYTS